MLIFTLMFAISGGLLLQFPLLCPPNKNDVISSSEMPSAVTTLIDLNGSCRVFVKYAGVQYVSRKLFEGLKVFSVTVN